jgi:DNA-binding transcriptional regulator YhcF (GntR family)
MAKINIRLRANSEEPKSQQITNQIADQISSGRLKRGDNLPSERQLAEDLGISREVVRRAYQRLTDRRMIQTQSTSGRIVLGSGKGGASKKGGAKKKGGAARGGSKKSSRKK